MFVVTADQVGSRHSADKVAATLVALNTQHEKRLLLPADRTAGDELQLLTNDPALVLTLILDLTRDGQWSVGVGVGAVRQPLPADTREATGEAFYAARDAVTRAKKQSARFALTLASNDDDASRPLGGSDVEALITLLLTLRERRTDGGWELFDLLSTGLTQSESAEKLGITAGAASLRARAAGIRVERAASEALVRLLDTINGSEEAQA
jgi:hypothetical protein